MSKCYSDSLEIRKKKKQVLEDYSYLIDKTCCNRENCEIFSNDLENLQHDCDDVFRDINVIHSEVDDKGLTKGTVCEIIKNKKNTILDKLHRKTASSTKSKSSKKGGKRINKSTKKRKGKRRQ